MDTVDQILNAQVLGESRTLHNASYLVVNKEGK